MKDRHDTQFGTTRQLLLHGNQQKGVMKLAKVGLREQQKTEAHAQFKGHRFSMTQFLKESEAQKEGCSSSDMFVEALNGVARSAEEAVIFFVQL